MIQRIQTLYLLLVVAALLVVTLGTSVFSFQSEENKDMDLLIKVNVFGIQADATLSDDIKESDRERLNDFLQLEERTNKVKARPVLSFPFYLIAVFMTLLAVATLLTYKNLKTQQKLGRFNFILNLSAFVFVVIIYYASKNQAINAVEGFDIKARLDLGFYCLIIATAFSFLANIGIKRDLKLIESIDRIR